MKRVVLITGAAAGIGRACVELFTKAGWVAVGLDKQRHSDSQGGAVRMIQADVSCPEEVVGAVQELSDREGRLDAVVNNAAVQICKPLLETTIEEWDLIMATNVRSSFVMACSAHGLLRESRGAVINVSSVHALATSVGLAAYACSKGALVALTRAMALELAGDGIRVNAVLPGAVDTEMLRGGLTRGHLQAGGAEDLIRRLGHRHAMGRVGRPEEIARAILFLADGNESSFITGQTLTVDGGAIARLSTE